MIVTQAVQQPVHGQQTELGGTVRRLAHRALDGYRDVADTCSLVTRKGEHVGRRVVAEESRIEIL